MPAFRELPRGFTAGETTAGNVYGSRVARVFAVQRARHGGNDSTSRARGDRRSLNEHWRRAKPLDDSGLLADYTCAVTPPAPPVVEHFAPVVTVRDRSRRPPVEAWAR